MTENFSLVSVRYHGQGQTGDWALQHQDRSIHDSQVDDMVIHSTLRECWAPGEGRSAGHVLLCSWDCPSEDMAARCVYIHPHQLYTNHPGPKQSSVHQLCKQSTQKEVGWMRLCWVLCCRMKPELFQSPLGPPRHLNGSYLWDDCFKILFLLYIL